MKNILLTRKLLVLACALMCTVLAHGQKKVYVVGAGTESAIESQDQVLIDSISQWVEVVYADQTTFNSNTDAAKYDGIDGVILLESVNSKTIVNFGETENFPVPCITMEAGLVSTWGLLAIDGGIWGYGGTDCEDIDLNWRIVNPDHKIISYAGGGMYQTDDVVAWSTHTDASSYGVPYLYGIMEDIDVIATAARTDKGTNAANVQYSQDEALSIFEIPSINLLYLCGSKGYIEGFATQEFYDILHESVRYMFDPRAEVIGIGTIAKTPFQVWPNPSNGITTVTFDAPVASSVMLQNITGVAIAQFEAVNNQVVFDAATLAPGVYFIVAGTESAKLIVE